MLKVLLGVFLIFLLASAHAENCMSQKMFDRYLSDLSLRPKEVNSLDESYYLLNFYNTLAPKLSIENQKQLQEVFRTKLSNIEEYQKQSNNNLHKLTMKQFQILNSEYIKTKEGMFPKEIETTSFKEAPNRTYKTEHWVNHGPKKLESSPSIKRNMDIERPDIMIKETFVHDDLVWNQKRDDAVNNLLALRETTKLRRVQLHSLNNVVRSLKNKKDILHPSSCKTLSISNYLDDGLRLSIGRLENINREKKCIKAFRESGVSASLIFAKGSILSYESKNHNNSMLIRVGSAQKLKQLYEENRLGRVRDTELDRKYNQALKLLKNYSNMESEVTKNLEILKNSKKEYLKHVSMQKERQKIVDSFLSKKSKGQSLIAKGIFGDLWGLGGDILEGARDVVVDGFKGLGAVAKEAYLLAKDITVKTVDFIVVKPVDFIIVKPIEKINEAWDSISSENKKLMWDSTWDVMNSTVEYLVIGPICNIIGKEPGDGCNIGVGGGVNSDGEIVLLDGNGTPSVRIPRETLDWDQSLEWMRKMETEDYIRQGRFMDDGVNNLIFGTIEQQQLALNALNQEAIRLQGELERNPASLEERRVILDESNKLKNILNSFKKGSVKSISELIDSFRDTPEALSKLYDMILSSPEALSNPELVLNTVIQLKRTLEVELYQKAVPIADVSAEIFCLWEDSYCIDGELFQAGFSRSELNALKEFNLKFEKVCDESPENVPHIKQVISTSYWLIYNQAGCKALLAFPADEVNSLLNLQKKYYLRDT